MAKKHRLKPPKANNDTKHLSLISSAVSAASGSSNSQKPHFCFEYIISGWGVKECTNGDRAALATTLEILGNLTWAEIQSSGRHQYGTEQIPQNQLNISMPKVVTKDVKILAFRFSGKKPMIGFREHRLFHILALDRNFTVYPH